MKVLDKPAAPKWFKSLSSNLSKIEANKAAYEDLEEGVVAPSDEVFTAARKFVPNFRSVLLSGQPVYI